MPTGQPDSHERDVRDVRHVDRIIREAIEAGEFDDLAGSGKPIPGAGRVDDDLWWIRSWVERNREPDPQDPTNSE